MKEQDSIVKILTKVHSKSRPNFKITQGSINPIISTYIYMALIIIKKKFGWIYGYD